MTIGTRGRSSSGFISTECIGRARGFTTTGGGVANSLVLLIGAETRSSYAIARSSGRFTTILTSSTDSSGGSTILARSVGHTVGTRGSRTVRVEGATNTDTAKNVAHLLPRGGSTISGSTVSVGETFDTGSTNITVGGKSATGKDTTGFTKVTVTKGFIFTDTSCDVTGKLSTLFTTIGKTTVVVRKAGLATTISHAVGTTSTRERLVSLATSLSFRIGRETAVGVGCAFYAVVGYSVTDRGGREGFETEAVGTQVTVWALYLTRIASTFPFFHGLINIDINTAVNGVSVEGTVISDFHSNFVVDQFGSWDTIFSPHISVHTERTTRFGGTSTTNDVTEKGTRTRVNLRASKARVGRESVLTSNKIGRVGLITTFASTFSVRSGDANLTVEVLGSYRFGKRKRSRAGYSVGNRGILAQVAVGSVDGWVSGTTEIVVLRISLLVTITIGGGTVVANGAITERISST